MKIRYSPFWNVTHVALTGSKYPTFRDNIGLIGCTETHVTNCKWTSYKIPKIQNLLFSSCYKCFSVCKFLILLQTLSLFPATSPLTAFIFCGCQISINFSWSKGGAQHYLSSDFPRSHPTEFPSSPNATISLKHECSKCQSINQSISQSRDTLRPEFSPWEITAIKTRSYNIGWDWPERGNRACGFSASY